MSFAIAGHRNDPSNSARKSPHPNGALFRTSEPLKGGLPAFKKTAKARQVPFDCPGRRRGLYDGLRRPAPRPTDVRSWPELT
jgi:hypothetical protein